MTNRKENTKGVLASAVNELSLTNSEKSLEFGSSYINIRPTSAQASMLEVIRRIKGKKPTSIMQDDISEALADFLMKSKDFIPIIAKAVEAHRGNGEYDGALGILSEKKVFKEMNLSILRSFKQADRDRSKEIPQGEIDDNQTLAR